MDASPPGGSQENLQSAGEPSSPTSPHDSHGQYLGTLIGPPGTSGIAFSHTHRHDDSTSLTDDSGAKLRKKFKKVIIRVAELRSLCRQLIMCVHYKNSRMGRLYI